MLVQVRGAGGSVLARQYVADPDEAMAVAQRWLTLLIEDAADPLDGIRDVPAIEVLPEGGDWPYEACPVGCHQLTCTHA